MRVIAGSARGTPLSVPRGRGTRPITDRVKETLFAILGDRTPDARVVDLYAGSGAIGIEALSRGAATVDFVEHGRQAIAVLRANLERTRLAGDARVHAAEVNAFLGAPDGGPWDLAILDPPYELSAIVAPLGMLRSHLAPGATVVLKHFWRTDLPPVEGLVTERQRRFGETMLTYWTTEGA